MARKKSQKASVNFIYHLVCIKECVHVSQCELPFGVMMKDMLCSSLNVMLIKLFTDLSMLVVKCFDQFKL